MATTTRIAPGIYRTSEGFEVRKVQDWDDTGYSGWHVISPEGEWCCTKATKREAVESASRIAAEEN